MYEENDGYAWVRVATFEALVQTDVVMAPR